MANTNFFKDQIVWSSQQILVRLYHLISAPEMIMQFNGGQNGARGIIIYDISSHVLQIHPD